LAASANLADGHPKVDGGCQSASFQFSPTSRRQAPRSCLPPLAPSPYLPKSQHFCASSADSHAPMRLSAVLCSSSTPAARELESGAGSVASKCRSFSALKNSLPSASAKARHHAKRHPEFINLACASLRPPEDVGCSLPEATPGTTSWVAVTSGSLPDWAAGLERNRRKFLSAQEAAARPLTAPELSRPPGQPGPQHRHRRVKPLFTTSLGTGSDSMTPLGDSHEGCSTQDDGRSSSCGSCSSSSRSSSCSSRCSHCSVKLAL